MCNRLPYYFGAYLFPFWCFFDSEVANVALTVLLAVVSGCRYNGAFIAPGFLSEHRLRENKQQQELGGG